MDNIQGSKELKKELNLDNKTLAIIGLCVFIVAAGAFLFLFRKMPFTIVDKPQEASNVRLVEELDKKKSYNKNSPEWLSIRTGELGEMLTNGEMGPDKVVEELMSMATVDSAKSLDKKKEDYYLSINNYLKLIRQLDEKVVTTRYSVPVYLNDNECYIDRAQYFKKIRLCYRQRFKKEDGQWKIAADGASNDFDFKK